MLISNVKFRKTSNYVLPPVAERMRTAFVTLDFSVDSQYDYDLSYADNQGSEIVVQSLTVDNSNNNADVTVSSDKSLKYERVVKAGELRVINIPAIDPSFLSFTSSGTGTAKVYLHNFPSLPDQQNIGAPMEVTIAGNTPINITETNPAVNELASVQALAANAARKYLLIQNNDEAANIFIKFGAAATLTSIKVGPGGSYEPNLVSGQTVNIISDVALTGTVTVLEGE